MCPAFSSILGIVRSCFARAFAATRLVLCRTDRLRLQTRVQSVAKLMTHNANFWNLLDELRTTAKKYTVSQITPRPPNQCWSLFPVLWSFRAWTTLCRGEGGGGCFTWYLNTRKFAKTVKCIIRFATDCSSTASIGSNGLSSSWSPNVHVGLASMSRTSKPRFSVGGVPGLLQPSRLSIEKLSVLRGPHVILCLTGRKCALSWPVSLYWLQFPRLEWWRWGCLLPCPTPCRVVCIRSQGLGWSRVWHKWSMLAGVWAFARALVRSNATCAARTRHPRTWKWRRSSFFPPSSNGMEHRWSDCQHTSFVESLWRSLGVAHSSSLRAARGHFPSGMERRARGQIPLCWTLATRSFSPIRLCFAQVSH